MPTESYVREEITSRVVGEYDVIVAGAGMAGCAAAVAAARAGQSVLLLEKTIILGGLATAGFVLYFNPCLCDRRGRKIMGGLAEEFMKLSGRYGNSTVPQVWRDGATYRSSIDPGPQGKFPRLHTVFSPSGFALALDELVHDEGVDLLLDTLACRPVMDGNICRGVSVETKEGRIFYGCRVLIDTTGDSDMMVRGGAPHVVDDNWLTYWSLGASLAGSKRATETGDPEDAVELWTFGARPNGAGHPDGEPKHYAGTADEITAFVIRGREMLRERLRGSGDRSHSRPDAVSALSTVPHYRTTRCIHAQKILNDNDGGKTFGDSIGVAVNEQKDIQIYEIPYSTLWVPNLPNMITAGRTISATGAAREVTRLIAPCILTGQAAGEAARLAVERDCPIGDVPIGTLQDRMEATGVTLHV